MGGLSSTDPSTPSGNSPAAVSRARRWVADPLPLLGLVGVAGVLLGILHLVGTAVPWQVPALLAVVGAGLALSGST
ncbi:hypothetical protein FNH13_01255 [Ornithinimicrobium ciconiae]|uniref:Uncharacterized protein n=1 Tax=Ornithinimicrobium ciconiae TaxID=2594265 RepID=A0A516G6X6_9MICO|nr:hypothetical protein [Ornithinimicrobium ciconiae]QDO87120.1 hypothetical protein FNH13_01255 [Ornithinimicrobium ciconiae]